VIGFGSASGRKADAERVELQPPDISAWRTGNTGIPFVTTLDSGRPGPHAAINALMHGNEISGAIALDHFMRQNLAPLRGKLSCIFANTAAFETFNPATPNTSRFIDEDMNRLWADGVTDGGTNLERSRVRVLRPFFETVDMLLDLHSMQSESPPLLLSGPSEKGRTFARSLNSPAVIVCDTGHANGMRLRDFAWFNTPGDPHVSILAECGQHWRRGTEGVAIDTVYRFLLVTGMIADDDAQPHLVNMPVPQHWIEVSRGFAPKHNNAAFTEAFIGMEVIPGRGTPFARDGDSIVYTPHDDCVLIMPSRQLAPGQTAVRLGRRHAFDDGGDD
jgi:predicted deacylase